MAVVFDPDKDLINVAKHGLSLSAFRGFDHAPIVKLDERMPYGEARYRAWGLIRGEPLLSCVHGPRRRYSGDKSSPGPCEGDASP